MDSYRYYECSSCSYLVRSGENGQDLSWCPMCRGNLEQIAEPTGVEWRRDVLCDECGVTFTTNTDAKFPYKCTNCNHTFLTTPHTYRHERL
ncbi:hypothetical protein JW905_00570 [bacterium]|nr:hypothetical protein [candidate division CSSED10-310 bacterium]